MEIIYWACLYWWFRLQHCGEFQTSPKLSKLCWLRRQSSDTWNNREPPQPVAERLKARWRAYRQGSGGVLRIQRKSEGGSRQRRPAGEVRFDVGLGGWVEREKLICVSKGIAAGMSQPQSRLGCGQGQWADEGRQLGWSQEWRARSRVLGSYTEAKDYYRLSEHTGVCSE